MIKMDSGTIAREIARIDIRLNPKMFCKEVLAVICKRLGYRFGSIILVNEGGEGAMFSAYNLPPNYVTLVQDVSEPILSSPSGDAIESGDVVTVNDINHDSRLKPWGELLKNLSVKTITWVPLFSKGNAFGTYILYDNRKRDVSSSEVGQLRFLSNLFSLAIIANEYIDELTVERGKLKDEIKERLEVENKLRVAKDEAENANKVKSQFLTNMSHELRTPMNAIMGFAELLRQEEDDPIKMESLNTIYESSERLLILINNILNFSEIESGELVMDAVPFSLEELMVELYDEFRGQVARKPLVFHVIPCQSIPVQMKGDRYHLKQVLENILDNAIKFTSSGEILLQNSYGKKNAVISIKDSGIGIPPGKQVEIFNVFNKADMSSTRRHGGLGLGLSIASRLVKQMGGTIDLESRVGEGTTFTITLPLKV